MEERVQKIIAAAGITSRRQAEQLILEGRVRVNGQVVTEMGVKADPDKDHIKVDGKLINPKQPPTYVMLNKPLGHVTTMADPEGRPMVSDLLKGIRTRVYPVGRLDYNTEGLLLLTNDGDFAHLVTHPSHELPKTYLVKVKGVLEDRNIDMLEKGVFLQDGKTAPARVRRLRKEEANSWVEITIHEGRKRQVRRMIDHTGHSVIKLKRIRVGNLELGDLPVGTYRHLTADEVAALRDMAQGPGQTAPVVSEAPARRSGADWKRMEVEAIPGPVKRGKKPSKERPAAAVRGERKVRPAGKGFGTRPAAKRAFGERAPRAGERRLWQGEARGERAREAGKRPFVERKPWQGEGRGERASFQRRGPSSRPAGAGGGFRTGEKGSRSFGERTTWQGAQRSERPAFQRRGPSARPAGAGEGSRPREAGKRPYGERKPWQGEARGERPQRSGEKRPWQGDKAAGRSYDGTKRPFVKKGPRPAGGPAAGGRRDERRGGFGKSWPAGGERPRPQRTWQGEGSGRKPSSGDRSLRTFSPEGQGSGWKSRSASTRPWQGERKEGGYRTGGASSRRGQRTAGGRPAGRREGQGRPAGGRPVKGRGPRKG